MSRQRSAARHCALQALYQWEVASDDVREVETQFAAEHDMSKADVPYFQELLRGVAAQRQSLDEALAPHLDRAIGGLDPVERAILRIGVYELMHRLDVPYRVVINEAVEMAKTFGAEQSHRYVNGVLDKVARKARAVEMQRAAK